MLRTLNFFLSFRFNFDDTPLYGSQLDNGTWVGMVGLIKNQVYIQLSFNVAISNDILIIVRIKVRNIFVLSANCINQ